jgi:hypothetical protein
LQRTRNATADEILAADVFDRGGHEQRDVERVLHHR